MGLVWREIRGFILWTYQRGSLRYDIMCALIVAFIFLTPRGGFHDLPPANVEGGPQGAYRSDAQPLGPAGAERDALTARLLSEQACHEVRVRPNERVRDA